MLVVAILYLMVWSDELLYNSILYDWPLHLTTPPPHSYISLINTILKLPQSLSFTRPDSFLTSNQQKLSSKSAMLTNKAAKA